jgi:hypothetical protein
MGQVICPGAHFRAKEITEHTEVRRQQEKEEPPPGKAQGQKEIESQYGKKQFFDSNQVLHGSRPQ